MRHADAESKKPGMSDFERELTELGRETTKKMATALKRMGLRIDILVSSPLVRAVQTAEIFREIMGVQSDVVKLNELIPGSDFQELMKIIFSLKAENVLAVGHEPHIGEFLGWIIGLKKPIEFKKNTTACVEFSSLPSPRGSLKWLIHPDMILKLL
ncbi:MAG: phosphohistidine phosphatase SixA [Candidatus Kryptonium sp.]